MGQTFEERRRGRPADVFNIIQKRPNTNVHLKVDEAMEGRRSHDLIYSQLLCLVSRIFHISLCENSINQSINQEAVSGQTTVCMYVSMYLCMYVYSLNCT